MLPQSFLLCEVLTLVIDHFLFYFRLSLQAFLAYHIFLMCHHLSDTSFILFRLISTHMYVYSIHSFYTSHLFFLVSSLYLLFQGSYPTLLVLVWMGFASGFLSRSPYSLFLAQSVLGFSRFLSSTRLFLRSTGPRFCDAPCFGLTKKTRISYLSDTVIVSRYSTLDSRYQVSLQIRVPFQHHLGGGRRHVWSLQITPVLIIFISHYSILLRGRSIR